MRERKKNKLLYKTSKNFLIIGVIAVILSLIALFFIIQYALKDEVEDALNSIAFRVEKRIIDSGELTNVMPIILSKKVIEIRDEIIKDTIMYDPIDKEDEVFTQLTKYSKIKSKNYRITVRTRAVDSDDILLAILGSYAAILLSLIIAQFFINRKSNSLIWKPFFDNLKAIKSFSLNSSQPIKLIDTDIQEFSELNTEVQILTNKVVTDYNNLKQFTEDISHEIQTPLAIIQAKIDNLVDENEITENQYNLLIDIQSNCKRLAVLNKKLILLAKIENQQFKSTEKINFTNIIKKAIEDFEELTPLPIRITNETPIEIYLDQHLARVIADNLLSNAIKYTTSNGTISIETINNRIIISNSGEQAIKEPHKLFNRFFRENHSKKSLGLGLSIIKKICDTHNYTINYSFHNTNHVFTVIFN